MLDKIAFASSLAVLAGLAHLAFSALGVIAPRMFEFLFNAQFFGAHVAALLPKTVSFGQFAGTWLALVVSGWVFGYVWAALYNWLARAAGLN